MLSIKARVGGDVVFAPLLVGDLHRPAVLERPTSRLAAGFAALAVAGAIRRPGVAGLLAVAGLHRFGPSLSAARQRRAMVPPNPTRKITAAVSP